MRTHLGFGDRLGWLGCRSKLVLSVETLHLLAMLVQDAPLLVGNLLSAAHRTSIWVVGFAILCTCCRIRHFHWLANPVALSRLWSVSSAADELRIK